MESLFLRDQSIDVIGKRVSGLVFAIAHHVHTVEEETMAQRYVLFIFPCLLLLVDRVEAQEILDLAYLLDFEVLGPALIDFLFKRQLQERKHDVRVGCVKHGAD